MGTMAAKTQVRIALVEDHAATRAELVRIFSNPAAPVRLVSSFADAESFLAAVSKLSLAVALIDLRLPGIDGCEAIRQLADRAPDVRGLALTSFADERSVIEALSAGAYGYLLKDESPARLVDAIVEAALGAHPVSSRVAGFLIARAARGTVAASLSDREEELAGALAEGLTYAECAERMGIALGTVQDYVKRLYRKLDVSSRKEVREWVKRNVAPA